MRPPRPPLLDPIAWRTVWVLAMFDLPVETRAQRRAYARFRMDLLADAFARLQFSVYFRRMGLRVPAEGEVRFLTVTDAQFARIQVFAGKRRKSPEVPPAPLESF
jgi:CRISPR-associated protein Cas2